MNKKDLYIKAEDGEVFLKDTDTNDIVYRIRRQELPLKRNGKESEWIMQLMDKTWIDVGTCIGLLNL